MTEIDKPKEELKVGRAVAFLGFLGRLPFAPGVFALTLMCGVVVMILRYAFHVELWDSR